VTCQASSSYARNNNLFVAEGPGGWIRLDPAYAYRGIGATTSRGPLIYPEAPQQALQMDNFAACILTGRKPPVPGELGRDHMAIVDAVYRSAAGGGNRIELLSV
jgi:glucose-fructose oxidoreductase